MIHDIENNNHYIADEGKVFYKNGAFGKEIWLGVGDSIENWQEILEEEVEDV